jgi:4'-phosphopantetheinyl transferase EntD
MIECVLPANVESVEAFKDLLDERLFPQEEGVIAQAVDKRRREFTTTRACARAALARLGLPRSAIVRGPHGAPGWPPGVVGSMTHCVGYRAAAVAREDQVAGIGLDAEPHQPLPERVLDFIALRAEVLRLEALAERSPRVCWDRLLFSAKESAYKAWYPLTGRRFDFTAVDVTFDPVASSFEVRVPAPASLVNNSQLTQMSGRWLVHKGFVVTAIVLRPNAVPG